MTGISLKLYSTFHPQNKLGDSGGDNGSFSIYCRLSEHGDGVSRDANDEAESSRERGRKG